MNRPQAELETMVRETLGEHYRALAVTRYTLDEDMTAGRATIATRLAGVEETPRAVEGEGVGMIDALFNGLKASLRADFPSLDHIHFVGFGVSGDFSDNTGGAGSDALGVVELTVENTNGRRFTFGARSRSVSASSVEAVVRAVEHFVNAELAVLRVLDWVDDARSRSRTDLVTRYTQRLSDLVINASYSETVDRRRDASGL